jgi:capsular polysaccharide transport system permease protein
VIQYHVFKGLFRRELRERVGDTLWSFISTIFDVVFPILGFYAVYAFLGRQGIAGIPLPLFLITGIFTWFTMRKIIQRTSMALRANLPFMSYRPVQPLDPIIIRTVIETILFLGAMVFILAALAYFGFDASIKNPVMIAFLYLMVPLFGFGLGLLLLQLSTFIPWTQMLLGILFRVMMLASCVVYSLHEVPTIAHPVFLLNPVVHFMELIRSEWFPYYDRPEGVSVAYVVLSTIVLLYFGLALFRQNKRKLLQLTLQVVQAS